MGSFGSVVAVVVSRVLTYGSAGTTVAATQSAGWCGVGVGVGVLLAVWAMALPGKIPTAPTRSSVVKARRRCPMEDPGSGRATSACVMRDTPRQRLSAAAAPQDTITITEIVNALGCSVASVQRRAHGHDVAPTRSVSPTRW